MSSSSSHQYNLNLISNAGAKRAREVVFSVLHDAMVEGDLSITKAVAAVKDIFAENAKKFYKLHKLDVSSKDSDIEPHIPSPFIKEELHGSLKDSSTDSDVEPCISSYFQNEELYGSSKDVTLVRIIWIDASGQHRCRVSFTFVFKLLLLPCDNELFNDMLYNTKSLVLFEKIQRVSIAYKRVKEFSMIASTNR